METMPSLSELYAPIEGAVHAVRAEIARVWQEALRLVRVPVAEQPKLGGKMLRPALCLLSAGAIGAEPVDRFVRMASAFEMLHVASLAHDDVIDRAVLRRGASSLNMLWDNHAAVLGGDYLVARAVEVLAEYDCCPVIANAIRSVRCMAEGELMFFGRENEPFLREECIALAEQKTASLFAEACSAPTYVIDPAHRDALYCFGTRLGIAFQIVDDLLDVTQPADTLGKPSCGDVVEGKRTLPIMYMRESLDEGERARLDGFRNAEMSTEDRAWVAETAARTGALARTEAEARAYADEARHALAALPPSRYRESMEGIVEFVLVRAS
jgi:octaprenyl-diphosphate synthase